MQETPKYVACVGSRALAHGMRPILNMIGAYLAETGWTCRSGNAEGADHAWAQGFNQVDPTKVELYLANGTKHPEFIVEGNEVFDDPDPWCYEELELILEESHIYNLSWDRNGRSRNWINLHARNMHQVQGRIKGARPCSMLLAWTPGGLTKGGTATAIKYAEYLGIPVRNIGNDSVLVDVLEVVSKHFATINQ